MHSKRHLPARRLLLGSSMLFSCMAVRKPFMTSFRRSIAIKSMRKP